MRFLCLHGMGTSSEIFASQLGPVLLDLERAGHEFIFLDGLHECKTTPEIASVYPAPYLCYYTLPTPALVRAAHELVLDTIDQEGPIDAVIAFSQGAALASSLLLEHAKTSPFTDLFRAAVFIGASLPFNLDDETGADIWKSTSAVHYSKVTASDEPTDLTTAGLSPEADLDETSESSPINSEDRNVALEGEFCGEVGIKGALGVPENPFEFNDTLLARYHPDRSPADLKIRIPTLHVIGKEDPYAGQAYLLAQMCEESVRDVLAHLEGHCVPRKKDFRAALVGQISRLITMADFYGH